MNTANRLRFTDMPPAQQAGILCNDPRFQRFAAIRCGMPGQQFSNSAAAEYLRNCCNITSRRDLNNSQIAQNRFQILRTEFDAWTGKISTPIDWQATSMTRAERHGSVARCCAPSPHKPRSGAARALDPKEVIE